MSSPSFSFTPQVLQSSEGNIHVDVIIPDSVVILKFTFRSQHSEMTSSACGNEDPAAQNDMQYKICHSLFVAGKRMCYTAPCCCSYSEDLYQRQWVKCRDWI